MKYLVEELNLFIMCRPINDICLIHYLLLYIIIASLFYKYVEVRTEVRI